MRREDIAPPEPTKRELAEAIVRAADEWETATMDGSLKHVDPAGHALSEAIQRWRAAQGRTDLRRKP